MRIERADRAAKGWYAGPWSADLAVALGYANAGIDDPHLHRRTTEIYLVAPAGARRGSSAKPSASKLATS